MKQNWKKLLSILIAVVMMVSIFVACANNSNASTADASGDNAYESTLHKVLATKKLTVGVIGGSAPWSWEDENGDWQGFEVCIAQKIADSLEADLELVELTSDTRISSVEAGKVDICFGNTTLTAARAQKVYFTDPHIISSEKLLVKDGSGITSVFDLPDGAKVGVTKGATCDQVLLGHRDDLEIVYFTSPSDGIVAVDNGQVLAFAEDENMMKYLASQYSDGLIIVGDPLATTSYNCLILPLGDDIWQEYLNQWLFLYNINGENAADFLEWFGTERSGDLAPLY